MAIAFINQGKILKIGSPQQLKQEISNQLLEVQCYPLMKASHIFQNLPGINGVTAYGTTLHLITGNPDMARKSVEESARQNGIRIESIKPIEASLEDVFATLEKVNDEIH